MRRTDALILAARTISRNNANADGSNAISDDEILQYLNDAQDRMQNLICAKKNIAKIFVTQQIISLVGGTESYTVPDRVLMNKQIEMVEFSASGNLADYVQLQKVSLFNRDTNSSNYPTGYFKRGNQIFITPIPSVSSGSLRVTYERELDDLDIPRGLISAIGSGTSSQFATVTLNATADAYESTTPGWSSVQFCSFVDSTGARKCFNVPVSSYNTGTNLVTPSPSPFVYTSLDSALAVGDVAVFNKYTTTFSQLPDTCERYLIHSAARDLFARDSSSDLEMAIERVAAIEEDILKQLASQTGEVQYIPQMNWYDW